MFFGHINSLLSVLQFYTTFNCLISRKVINYIFFKKRVYKISQINMACKWLTVFFLSDLNYITTRCKKTTLCVESIIIGSDNSTIQAQLLEKLSNMYDISLMATFR